ncbi:hypothetical protein CDES_03910 [Corynebacterium deserti GIMN1.010]|uniref:DUF3152 domain-containing protein n=1 Tax=Corynebacterium deserti GIMN1.010 TaxID=931089 RepID=A0A0M4CHD4_9CORY|nr:hypothetical protein CDES_03910 [Corynebacterium deserti GIMN1.010]
MAEPFLVRFARDYGWRAYAIPVLTVITIWVLVDVFSTDQPTASGASGEASTSFSTPTSTHRAGPDPAQAEPQNIPLTELPPGGAFTDTGAGTFRQVGVALPRIGEGAEQTFTYVVEIEDGLNTAPYGGDDAFVASVDATLSDPKGWIADPAYAFEHVSGDVEPDLRIQLTSLDTTHQLCGNDIAMETSCFYSDGGRVLINESRWIRGAAPFEGDIGSYRQYLINHEVGHGLGYSGHDACGGPGELAPIMMQQTLSLNNSELFRIDPNEVYSDDNATCEFNPWPYPRGF